MDPLPKIRCMGAGHSWSPLFADDGAWIVDTSNLNDIVWSATDSPTQVIKAAIYVAVLRVEPVCCSRWRIEEVLARDLMVTSESETAYLKRFPR